MPEEPNVIHNIIAAVTNALLNKPPENLQLQAREYQDQVRRIDKTNKEMLRAVKDLTGTVNDLSDILEDIEGPLQSVAFYADAAARSVDEWIGVGDKGGQAATLGSLIGIFKRVLTEAEAEAASNVDLDEYDEPPNRDENDVED